MRCFALFFPAIIVGCAFLFVSCGDSEKATGPTINQSPGLIPGTDSGMALSDPDNIESITIEDVVGFAIRGKQFI